MFAPLHLTFQRDIFILIGNKLALSHLPEAVAVFFDLNMQTGFQKKSASTGPALRTKVPDPVYSACCL